MFKSGLCCCINPTRFYDLLPREEEASILEVPGFGVVRICDILLGKIGNLFGFFVAAR